MLFSNIAIFRLCIKSRTHVAPNVRAINMRSDVQIDCDGLQHEVEYAEISLMISVNCQAIFTMELGIS